MRRSSSLIDRSAPEHTLYVSPGAPRSSKSQIGAHDVAHVGEVARDVDVADVDDRHRGDPP